MSLVTEVRIHRSTPETLRRRPGCLAFATVVIANFVVIRDIRLVQNLSGRFLAMPNRRWQTGRHEDLAHPINEAARAELERVVFEVYDRGDGCG